MSQQPAQQPAQQPPQQPWREPWLRGLLRCPADRAELADATGPDGELLLRCTDPAHPVVYPVQGGVPVLLVDEARPAGGAPLTPEA